MSIAFLTMCRNDHIWLKKWVEHNRSNVDDTKDLHVILHGPDAVASEIADECSTMVIPAKKLPGSFERRRNRMIRHYIAGLLEYHDVVVFNDVDELLCIHPDAGLSLSERLLSPLRPANVVSPVGVELVYQDDDGHIDMGKPILRQRPYGFLHSVYCKPCIFYASVFNGNQHVIPGEPLVMDPQIFLFHMRYADKNMFESRIFQRDEQLASGLVEGSAGWEAETALTAFNDLKRKFMDTDEAELNQHNIQGFLNVLQRRYKKTGGTGRRTFGRLKVPEAMADML